MMNRKKKKNRALLAALTLVILLGSLFHEDAAMTARAASGSAFTVEAEVLPSNKETYDIRLTVENQGADWEGTVRLTVDEGYRRPCAFDTTLSLPQGSRKQFVVKVPVGSIDNTNGTVVVTLLNRRDEVVAREEFNRLLSGQMESLSMGILSDAYSELTYLDMGGEEFYFYDNFYPIRLVELRQGSLVDALDVLTFLVIDQYNTSILTEEELEAIENWNVNGGVLIIGTGAYAEDVLSGFEDSYIGMDYAGIHTPGDGCELDYVASVYVDWSQLTMVDLNFVGDTYINLFTDYSTGEWHTGMGDGSMGVLPYSLTEVSGATDPYGNPVQEDFVLMLLENASSYASSRFSSSTSYYDNSISYIRRMLGVLGNSTTVLDFGVLRWIVVLYVIFVGPVLYLILRLLKRRELYWIAVPVTALLGIGLVFLAGRGFEVVSTKVYSVTVKNLSGNGKSVSYLHCYDANRREWDLRLAEGCEYAGPLSNTSYYSSNDESYYYHIKKEGETFSLGIKPDSNFEDSYFYLSSTGNDSGAEGSLSMQYMALEWSGISGTIVNETNRDMDYFAVLWNDSVYVYENLPAGATCYLDAVQPIFEMNSSSYYYSSYIYDFLQNFYYDYDYENVSVLSALGVGIYDVLSQSYENKFVVIGVVENWDKTVDDTCSEISYGCLYAVQ